MDKELEDLMQDIMNELSDDVATKITAEIVEEIRLLRKEVADAWMHRTQRDHFKALIKAKEEFIDMDIGSRSGKTSYQKLGEFYEVYKK